MSYFHHCELPKNGNLYLKIFTAEKRRGIRRGPQRFVHIFFAVLSVFLCGSLRLSFSFQISFYITYFATSGILRPNPNALEETRRIGGV